MLYIPNTTDEIRLFVPCNGRQAQGSVTFKLWNTTDRQVEYSAEVETKQAGASYLAFYLPERANALNAGEYEYRLIDDIGFLAVGVAKVVAKAVQYNEFEKVKTYKQYGSEE